MKKLSEHSGKLENVEIKGIEDFLSVAKKYDIDYAVKKEPESDTYHVYFQAGKMLWMYRLVKFLQKPERR